MYNARHCRYPIRRSDSLPYWWNAFLVKSEAVTQIPKNEVWKKCLEVHKSGVLSQENDRIGAIYNEFIEGDANVGDHN